MSPLNMVFRVIGVIMTLVGLIDVLLLVLPASVTSMLSILNPLKVAPDLNSALVLLGMGSAVYLLSEIAGRRPSKSY